MFRDLLRESYAAMRHNRRRTALTMLGMAWGIATVVLLLAYGAGFGRAVRNIFSNFGMQIMGVFPGRTFVPLVRHISPEAFLQANVQHDNRTFQMPVDGFNSQGQSIRALKMEEGR